MGWSWPGEITFVILCVSDSLNAINLVRGDPIFDHKYAPVIAKIKDYWESLES